MIKIRLKSLVAALMFPAIIALPSCDKAAPRYNDLILREFDESDVIVFGEDHGTVEAPQVIAALLDAGNGVQTLVALEMFDDTQQLDCNGGRLPESWSKNARFGNNSTALLHLICAQRGKTNIRLMYFLGNGQGDYDAQSARRIHAQMQLHHPERVIILTGATHAENRTGSLADHLRQLGLKVVTARVSSTSGTGWGCTGDASATTVSELQCGPNRIRPPFCTPDMRNGPVWTSKQLRSDRWDRCLAIPHMTPSPPAISERAAH